MGSRRNWRHLKGSTAQERLQGVAGPGIADQALQRTQKAAPLSLALGGKLSYVALLPSVEWGYDSMEKGSN